MQQIIMSANEYAMTSITETNLQAIAVESSHSGTQAWDQPPAPPTLSVTKEGTPVSFMWNGPVIDQSYHDRASCKP